MHHALLLALSLMRSVHEALYCESCSVTVSQDCIWANTGPDSGDCATTESVVAGYNELRGI